MKENERMLEIVGKFADEKVFVVGDVMVDHYVTGTTTRISPEAPVPIVKYRDEELGLGGAANVALNLKNLGANVILSGVYGNDKFGVWLGDRLDREGITNDCISVDEPVTILKQRIIANGQQICRIDTEEKPEAYDKILTRWISMVDFLDFKEISAIFISDYNKGAITDGLMDSVRRSGILFYCDPKSTNLSKYSGAAGITPNVQEAERFVWRSDRWDPEFDTNFIMALKYLFEIKSVLITKGAEGVSFWDSDMKLPMELAGHCVAIADTCGAGDTAFAVYGLSKSCGASTGEAAFLANLAGSVVVQKPRVAPITKLDLMRALNGEVSDG